MELIGSEKQVRWAAQIREARMPQLAQVVHYAATSEMLRIMLAPTILDKAEAEARIIAAYVAIREQTSAAWWIDHRSLNAQDLLGMMVDL